MTRNLTAISIRLLAASAASMTTFKNVMGGDRSRGEIDSNPANRHADCDWQSDSTIATSGGTGIAKDPKTLEINMLFMTDGTILAPIPCLWDFMHF
jgi:hypothetical protein